MMLIKPYPLSRTRLADMELEAEKKEWKRFGPCAVGKKALFLNSRFMERRLYIPISAVQRAYKRIAMSKGGFTGKGAFGAIPYLVVEFDNGKTEQFTFKYEDHVDLMLDYIGKIAPGINRMSKAAEAKWLEKQKRLEAKKQRIENSEHRALITQLEAARAFLNEQPELSTELSAAAKAKRSFERSKPAYKWVALAIIAAGLISTAYGAWSLANHTGDFALYFLLFGLAAVFMFSGANVLPTARNNKKAIEKRLEASVAAMSARLAGQTDFPLPARYAHPGVLNRMIDVLADNRAKTIPAAFETVKKDLKAINASVTVEQEEYDEIVAIKPMFLVHDYQ